MIVFRPLPLATGLTIAGCVVLVLLGNWQMRRLAYKEALIAAVEARAGSEPIRLGEAVARGGDLEYTKVRATGRFRHRDEAYLFSQTEDRQVGFQVLTPFDLSEGGTILVDRGFVPAALKDPAARAEGLIEGDVTVTGLLRGPRAPGAFTPPPDSAGRVWYVRDVAGIADALNIELTVPLILAADKTAVPGRWPEGGHTRLTFRNDHLSYALTWYCLAAVLLGVYLAYHWQSGRLRLGGAQRR